ncbi:hypothetical protein NL676_025711 [Syzygium grande]|nr:hypothetical protein NL676_025711 [Syzygium grande]
MLSRLADLVTKAWEMVAEWVREEAEERMAMEQFSFPFLCLEFPFLSFSISAFDDFLSVRSVTILYSTSPASLSHSPSSLALSATISPAFASRTTYLLNIFDNSESVRDRDPVI